MDKTKPVSRNPIFSPCNPLRIQSKRKWFRHWIGCCLIALLLVGIGTILHQREPSMAHAQGTTATVTCRLEMNPAYVGSQTHLIIEVLNVNDLYGYQLKLNYDPNRIEILDSDPDEEGVNLSLEAIGQSDDFVLYNYAEDGLIEIVVTQQGQVPGFDGDVILAKGRIRGLVKGSTTFQFGEVILANGSPTPIPSKTVDCRGEFVPAVFLPVVTKNFIE